MGERKRSAMLTSATPRPWPRLSEDLTGPKDPLRCQSCGASEPLTRWRECNASDKPTAVVVILCYACSDRLIEPHPRLYVRLEANAPMPGVMDLCLDCRYRAGVTCTHPDLTANGGPGLHVGFPRPGVALICDRGRGGGKRSWQQLIYPGPPTFCAGRLARDTAP